MHIVLTVGTLLLLCCNLQTSVASPANPPDYDDYTNFFENMPMYTDEIPILAATTRRQKRPIPSSRQPPGHFPPIPSNRQTPAPYRPPTTTPRRAHTLPPGGDSRPGYNSSDYTWPNGVIPYEIDSNIQFYMVKRIEDAMKFVTNYHDERISSVCVTFRPKQPSDQNFVKFELTQEKLNCRSEYAGFAGIGIQKIFVGKDCANLRFIFWNLLQVLSLPPEHRRPDRDQYVTVLWENIRDDPSGRNAFIGAFTKFDFLNGQLMRMPYDTQSRLHYSDYSLSRDPMDVSKRTLVNNEGEDIILGNAFEQPTKNDMFKIALLYCPNVNIDDFDPPAPAPSPKFPPIGDPYQGLMSPCRCLAAPDEDGRCFDESAYQWEGMAQYCDLDIIPRSEQWSTCRCNDPKYNVS